MTAETGSGQRHVAGSSTPHERVAEVRSPAPAAEYVSRDPGEGSSLLNVEGAYFRKVPVAEEVGFEPTEGCPSHDFQSCRFGRSRTPPGGVIDAEVTG